MGAFGSRLAFTVTWLVAAWFVLALVPTTVDGGTRIAATVASLIGITVLLGGVGMVAGRLPRRGAGLDATEAEDTDAARDVTLAALADHAAALLILGDPEARHEFDRLIEADPSDPVGPGLLEEYERSTTP